MPLIMPHCVVANTQCVLDVSVLKSTKSGKKNLPQLDFTGLARNGGILNLPELGLKSGTNV